MKLGRKRRGAAGGYAIFIVFLALGVFAFLYAAITGVSSQVDTMVAGQPAFTSSYDSATNTGMDMMLFPGIALFVMFGAVLVMISMGQAKRSGEDYA